MPSVEFGPAETTAAMRLMELALAEDFGQGRDVTSESLIPAGRQGRVLVRCREDGCLAGLPIGDLVFSRLDRDVTCELQTTDGARVRPGETVAAITGPLRSLLGGERTMLNFLTHLSGVATLTARFVEQVAGTKATILDTRKTLPGWRVLQKYAVRAGGGTNHRMGLYDAILIKDNHLAAWVEDTAAGPADSGSQTPGGRSCHAVEAARSGTDGQIPVQIEVDTLAQLADALEARPEFVLLDNMPPDILEEAVQIRDRLSPATLLEASGGVTLATVGDIAAAGIDRISVGGLTHSAPALDLAFDWTLE